MRPKRKPPRRAPRSLEDEADRRARRNRDIDRQTRKLLGRHYAAKYRVR